MAGELINPHISMKPPGNGHQLSDINNPDDHYESPYKE
jgi:hypothetical protein